MLLTRRRCLSLAALSLTACSPKKGTGYPGYVLIATSGDTTLAVVDLLSFKLLNPIPLDASPTAVVPGGPDHCYVLTPSSGSVHVINSSLKRVATRKFSDELSELFLSPDRRNLLAISAASREFIVVDAASLAVVHRYQLRSEPISLDVNAAGDVAIGLRGAPNLVFFRRGVEGREAAVDGEPGSLRFRRDGKVLIVAKPAARSLSILTVPNMQLMADLPLAMQPDNLCFNSDGGQLFVTGEGMDAVAIVFPYQTLEVEQTILAGRSPGVMACSNAPPYLLFVANSNGSDLSILDIDTRRVVGILGVGLRPSFIAITPDNQYALILNGGSNDMAVIRITAIRPSYQKKNGVALYTMLPVGTAPVHAAIMDRI
ncbi:MAG TPA: hypothetical protein VH351_01520 [Bryobacteraceae bacterium]|jgi:DNA-binding beta-propeller fold protein YncE|nr:hypothetical protein [Bryobacteraceae bacterium]